MRFALVRRLLRGIWTVLRRRGFRYFGYLLKGVLIPKVAYHVFYAMPWHRWRQITKVGLLGFTLLILVILSFLSDPVFALLVLLVLGGSALLCLTTLRRLELSRMEKRAREFTEAAWLAYTEDTFTRWSDLPVQASTRKAVEAARKANPNEEIVIGRIDQDGRVLGLYSQLPCLESVGEANFLERNRYNLDIVLIEDKVLVRKDYHGERKPFVREWHNLAALFGKANVPAIHHADPDRRILYMNLIPGRTMRDILVYAGAKIRDVQTRDDPQLAGLAPVERSRIKWTRGRELIASCFSEEFLSELEHQLNVIHACGMACLDVKVGNVVIDSITGVPWIVDFERVRFYRSKSSLAFTLRRDQDRINFNQIYGRNLITERSARAALAEQAAELNGWYAPIDFGHGLTVGSFWSVDAGTGRWEFLNRRIVGPLVNGKRVLDLGSNNGIMPIMMLRAGAREVVGVELSPVNVETARLLHSIYEWRDMRRYALRLHTCDMLEILQADWGDFDVVTAFCSLYYLSAEKMAQVVRKAAELAPVMIVQANTKSRSKGGNRKAEKASVPFLKNLLEDNGFPSVEIFAPTNYPRPLLVGRGER